MSKLSANAFEMLLARLDPDPKVAADRYEVLRMKLVKCLEWKGCAESHSDSLADEVIDRVAGKIEKGEAIENISAYACTVLRFVFLEYSRGKRHESNGELPEIAVDPEIAILEDPDERIDCLRRCMSDVVRTNDDRKIIIGYYDNDTGLKNKDQRKRLSLEFGLSMTALKVRACRIRIRLERCINDCVAQVV